MPDHEGVRQRLFEGNDELGQQPVEVGPLDAKLAPRGMLFVDVRVVRRETDAEGAFQSPLPAPTARLYERLVRALAARGHRRARAETPREFARAVTLAEGRPFLPLRDVVELFYRARFGGTDLSKDEERFVEEFVQQVLEAAAET